ncbi:acyl-CoA thioesterase [bacterium]|nr:acyl-CoA thioesterase [bacterium]
MTESGREPRRIKASVEVDVRFHEVDAQGVVWHGNYFHYLDLARAALLRAGGLGTSELLRAGFDLPVVDCEVRYRAPLRLEERARVETELVWHGSPELELEYRVVRSRDGVLAAEGRTRHRVVDASGAPLSVLPGIMRAWEERNGLR